MHSEIRAGLEEGIAQFNAGDFFECHDTLEEVWRGFRGPDRPFLQGLIQISIGYYHLTCENYPGAEHLLERGLEKLGAFPAQHWEIDVADLVRRASRTLAQVREVREGRRETYDPETIPKIRRIR